MSNTTEIQEKVTIVGQYVRTKMHDCQNGYTAFDVRTSDGVVSCTGKLLVPHVGATVKVTGNWTTTRFGKQLERCTVQEILADTESIYEYLIHIPTIGEETARTVADRLDEDLLSLATMEKAEQFLIKATGITEKRAETICAHIRRNAAHVALFLMLSEFRSGSAAADRIFVKYGEDAVKAILNDPYGIGMKYGLTFAECEHLAITMGKAISNDPRRTVACAIDRLNRLSNKGDCCVDAVSLAMDVRKEINRANLSLKPSKDKGEKEEEKKHEEPIARGISAIMALDNVMLSDSIVQDHRQFYSKSIFWQELRTAIGIRKIIRSAIRTECDPDELCTYAEAMCGVKYAEQQRSAFRMFQTGGLCVLTGGPGTGKTTVVKGLLLAYERLYPDNVIALCAPTGRASQRMKEATGRPASTIHRLLEYHPYGDSFSCKNETNPIEADLIVVDESSMISVDLAELLFNAVRPGTMVLLVGDTDQLPSVGPGNVLGDIIRSKTVPVTALTKTHRQGAGSPIIENAKRISSGNSDLVRNIDFEIVECAEEALVQSIRNQYVLYHKNNNPFAVQVLTTMRRDPLQGCDAISRAIQAEVNPKAKTSKGVRYGNTTYYVGDKIMMTRNNYNVGYFNGDIGVVKSIAPKEVIVEINGEEVAVANSLLCDMSLAYASTIHKSQGSEYNVVIVVIPAKPVSMLQRNILYTAITRAKKRVILIASDQTIFTCVNTVTAVQRKTLLCERLREMTRPPVYKTETTEGGSAKCFEMRQWRLSPSPES